MAVIDMANAETRAAPLAEPAGGDPIAAILRDLAVANQARLFPGDAGVEIVRVETGPERHHNENRFHRAVTVHYRRGGVAGILPVWVKFRPGLDRLFPVLAGYHQRLGGELIPAPYFAWHSEDEQVALLAGEFIAATPLRDILLKSAALGRSARLVPVFRAHGGKMRRFHDAFAPAETIYAHEVATTVTAALRATGFLSPAERSAVEAHAERAAALLGVRALPAVRNHNDWILRNIVVTQDGRDYLIDCDSMRYRPNWRWYDVAFLLLNLESGLKWSPLLTRPALSLLARALWQGYVGDGALPDGLSAAELAAVLYLVRLHWLFDGVVRRPNVEVMAAGTLNRRFLRTLKTTVVAGRFSDLDFF